MPRAASTTTEDKKTTSRKPRVKTAAKRTTTRRTTRADDTKRTTRTRRTRATRTTAAEAEGVIESVLERTKEQIPKKSKKSSRKAPTAFAGIAAERKARKLQIIVVSCLLLVGVGASAAVGVTDSGQIDVAQTINERNARMANMVDVDGPVTIAPVNGGDASLPDGGLIGLQPSTPAPAIPKTAAELNEISTGTTTVSELDTDDAFSATPVVDGVVTHSATTSVEAVAAEALGTDTASTTETTDI